MCTAAPRPIFCPHFAQISPPDVSFDLMHNSEVSAGRGTRVRDIVPATRRQSAPHWSHRTQNGLHNALSEFQRERSSRTSYRVPSGGAVIGPTELPTVAVCASRPPRSRFWAVFGGLFACTTVKRVYRIGCGDVGPKIVRDTSDPGWCWRVPVGVSPTAGGFEPLSRHAFKLIVRPIGVHSHVSRIKLC